MGTTKSLKLFAKPRHFFATLFVLACSIFVPECQAFSVQTPPTTGVSSPKTTPISPFPRPGATSSSTTTLVSPDLTGITEEACVDTARRMKRISVPVSTRIHPDGEVGISFVYWSADEEGNNQSTGWSFRQPSQRKRRQRLPPVVLIHGFDSSCLEYRRLGRKLAARGIDTYAVDLLGWGFTQLQGVQTFSAEAKVEALTSFLQNVVCENGYSSSFVITGASLGGAAAIEVASMNKDCAGLVLIDAQGFVDGIGPMASLPKPLAQVGAQVLKSIPLRSSANQMSYFDKKTYATDEAVTVGRLHCLRQDGSWSDALVSFMQSGGFRPSAKVPTVQIPSLVLWGRQDGILEGHQYATQFLETLPDAELIWLEECGHVPHLEQPDATAEAIYDFVQGRVMATTKGKINGALSSSVMESNQLITIAGATAFAAFAATFAADFLPVH